MLKSVARRDFSPCRKCQPDCAEIIMGSDRRIKQIYRPGVRGQAPFLTCYPAHVEKCSSERLLTMSKVSARLRGDYHGFRPGIAQPYRPGVRGQAPFLTCYPAHVEKCSSERLLTMSKVSARLRGDYH